ncbi:MAG: deoxyribodipyrimidine photo-lyase [Bdellovibrionales bacterium]|nr:deoxyribodipyrimidine photo-lyase [Bdellovibrionales bacterium]
MFQTSLCWLRRDLRLQDHRALFEACAQSSQVRLVFVFDVQILGRLAPSDRRVSYLHQCVHQLQQEVAKWGGQLDILHGDPVVEIPRWARQLNVSAVFVNEDYEGYAKRRDQAVAEALGAQGVSFLKFKDQVIFSGGEVTKSDGGAFRVFTPYWRAWTKKLKPTHLAEWTPDLSKLNFSKSPTNTGVKGSSVPEVTGPSLKELGFAELNSEIPSTASAAERQLSQFLEQVEHYAEKRDFPAVEGTSRLSVLLRFGLISVRAAVRGVYKQRNKGAETWLKELVWREFYQMIVDQFPRVESGPFQEKLAGIEWPGSEAHLLAWCEGRTGYPIVDAAMRQLNQTGWMHNRLRMIVASFLVKDLLIDWRRGEAYFAKHLMDFDLAANNGGWQWCASTGCDPQPYFRIFNPVSQSLKFDPAGEFIRRWVPELKSLESKVIHGPFLAKAKDLPSDFVLGRDYPLPLVDHQQQRVVALRLFKNLSGLKAQPPTTTKRRSGKNV